MPNAASASPPDPLVYQTQRAIILQAADRDVIAILQQSQRDIIAMLRELERRPAGIGRDIREAQLRLVQRNLNQELGKVWRQIGNVAEARRAEAAARAIGYTEELNKFKLLGAGLPDGALIADAIAQSQLDYAARGIDAMIARTSGASYVPLKDRVYNSNVNIGSQVDRLVNSALVRGLSAAEFAKEVRQFINPLTPGGVSYAALRLARTEINNSAHAASIQAVREVPWVDVMEWRLSGSHGRQDICDRLAKGGPNNDGRYPKGAVPAKPHPQCLCFVIAETVSDDDFENNLLAGHYNQYLDRYRNLQPGQVVRSGYGGGFPEPKPKAPAPKVKETKVANPAKPRSKPPSQAKPPTAAPPARVTPAAKPTAGTAVYEEHAKRLIAQGGSLAKVRNALANEFNLTKEQAEQIARRMALQVKGSTAARQANLTAIKTPQPISRVTPPAPTHNKPWVPSELPAGNVLPERTDIPASVKSHINELTSRLGGQSQLDVSRELQHQAGLVPGQVMHALGRVKVMPNINLNGQMVNAFYHGIVEDGKIVREIQLGDHLFTPYARSEQIRSEISGFKTSCGAEHDAAQSVLAHEFGHHVDRYIDSVLLREPAAVSDVIARDFWHTVASELRVNPPRNLSELGLKAWFSLNKNVITREVSTYASTNQREFFAEIWREYSGNPNARQHIKNIGGKISEILGRVFQ